MAKKIALGTLIAIAGLTLLGGVILPALIFLLPIFAVILLNPITWGLIVVGGWAYFIYKLGEEKQAQEAKKTRNNGDNGES